MNAADGDSGRGDSDHDSGTFEERFLENSKLNINSVVRISENFS